MRRPRNHQEEDRQLLSQTRLPEKVSHPTQVMRLAAQMMRAVGIEPPLSIPSWPRTESDAPDQKHHLEPQMRPPLQAVLQSVPQPDEAETPAPMLAVSPGIHQHQPMCHRWVNTGQSIQEPQGNYRHLRAL